MSWGESLCKDGLYIRLEAIGGTTTEDELLLGVSLRMYAEKG